MWSPIQPEIPVDRAHACAYGRKTLFMQDLLEVVFTFHSLEVAFEDAHRRKTAHL